MDLTRRVVLGLGAAVPLLACTTKPPRVTATGDWESVRAEFDLEPGVINLDNGWACSPPRVVMESFIRQMRAVARLPMRELQRLYREVTLPKVVPAVAQLLGVPEEELALVRNATEAIGTVLLGYPFAPGDEIVCSTEDCWHMLEMIERLGEGGAVVRRIELPVPASSPDALVEVYARAMTNRTKLVLVTHASNRTGQIMPVARICEVAHAHGAEVVVDAATVAVIAQLAAHPALVLVASHVAEVAATIRSDPRVAFFCLAADITGDQPRFDYCLREGVSEHRLGTTFLRQEAVLDRLERSTKSGGVQRTIAET